MLQKTLKEIEEIPHFAAICLEKNRKIRLPQNVYYLGMGASFIPSVALYYSGAVIYPELASEFAGYLKSSKKPDMGVLISQSGKSMETVECSNYFEKYIAITNDADSPLAKGKNIEKLVLLYAGEEKSISSKTYVNTLITLYQGLGFQTDKEVELLGINIKHYQSWGQESAEKIYRFFRNYPWKGFYILGSGPNLATAREAALTMSEVTKMSVQGMSLGEYDHGPKEAAANSIVVILDIKGKNRRRVWELREKLKRIKNCLLMTYSYKGDESTSPINTILPFNFLTYYLAEKLGIKKVYEIGSKVVED